jgi:hypothetical protein
VAEKRASTAEKNQISNKLLFFNILSSSPESFSQKIKAKHRSIVNKKKIEVKSKP